MVKGIQNGRINQAYCGKGPRGSTFQAKKGTGVFSSNNLFKDGRAEMKYFLREHPGFTVFMSDKKLTSLCNQKLRVNGQEVNLIRMYLNAAISNDLSNPVLAAMDKHKLVCGSMHAVISEKEGPVALDFLAERFIVNGLRPGKKFLLLHCGAWKTATLKRMDINDYDLKKMYEEYTRHRAFCGPTNSAVQEEDANYHYASSRQDHKE
jgi:hypothetical protein